MDENWKSGMGFWQGTEPEIIERMPLAPPVRGYEIDFVSSGELRLRRFYGTEVILTTPPIEEGTIVRCVGGGPTEVTVFVGSIQVHPPLPMGVYWWKRFRRWLMRNKLRG